MSFRSSLSTCYICEDFQPPPFSFVGAAKFGELRRNRRRSVIPFHSLVFVVWEVWSSKSGFICVFECVVIIVRNELWSVDPLSFVFSSWEQDSRCSSKFSKVFLFFFSLCSSSSLSLSLSLCLRLCLSDIHTFTVPIAFRSCLYLSSVSYLFLVCLYTHLLYTSHALELGNPIPTKPVFFLKPASSISLSPSPSGDRGIIRIPPELSSVSYEGEKITMDGHLCWFRFAPSSFYFCPGLFLVLRWFVILRSITVLFLGFFPPPSLLDFVILYRVLLVVLLFSNPIACFFFFFSLNSWACCHYRRSWF